MSDELKTLKDIYIEPLTTINKGKEIIKAEAVKYFKKCLEAEKMGAKIPEHWKFGHFFNLTEENLQ